MYEFCLPTGAKAVPTRPDWLHEMKYDGYRLRLERDGDRVRLITRGGYNWADRYPWIVEAALKHRQTQLGGARDAWHICGDPSGVPNLRVG